MTTRSNPYCTTCLNAHNGLNGRFCNVLGKYVEYDKTPKCEE